MSYFEKNPYCHCEFEHTIYSKIVKSKEHMTWMIANVWVKQLGAIQNENGAFHS